MCSGTSLTKRPERRIRRKGTGELNQEDGNVGNVWGRISSDI